MLKILLITLAIVAITVAGITWARHNGYCRGGDSMQHITERVSRKLDLNDEQKLKLEAFAETLQKLRSDWSERRTQMSAEVEDILAGPSLDRDRVIALLDERHQAVNERKGEVVDAFATFSDSLQPEQRTRLAELIAARMERRWGPPGWGR